MSGATQEKSKKAFDDLADLDTGSKDSTVRDQLSQFCQETSFTAITRIYQASSVFRRICWLVLFLAFLGWLTVQCYWLLDKYFKYPMEVKMDLLSKPEIEFPSVTVCNVNPVLRSKLYTDPFNELNVCLNSRKEVDEVLWESAQASIYDNYEDSVETVVDTQSVTAETTTIPLVEDPVVTIDSIPGYESETTNQSDVVPLERRRRSTKKQVNVSAVMTTNEYNKWDMLGDPKVSDGFYKLRDDQYEVSQTYASLTARYPEDTMIKGGHKLNDFLSSCKMGGFHCSPKNFTTTVNHRYGNCFTFNDAKNQTFKVNTKLAGPSNGLIMEFYIQQDEYVGALSQEAGVRILVHPSGSMPFPEDEGITISPGSATYVGLRKVDITRLPPPHGTCAKSGLEEDYYVTLRESSYSKLSCMKSCYQRLIMQQCQCAYALYIVPNNTAVCNMTNEDTESCVTEIDKTRQMEYASCDAKCPQPCNELQFSKTVSSAHWPSQPYADVLTSRIQKSSYRFMGGHEHVNPSQDFAKVYIYYGDLLFEKVEQQVAYESQNLISDIGGQLGLWLGLSAITIGELCTLIMTISQIITHKIAGRKRLHATPVQALKLDHVNFQ